MNPCRLLKPPQRTPGENFRDIAADKKPAAMDGEVRKINPCSGQISHIQWASENWQAEIDFGEGKLSLELHTLDSLGLASTIQRDGKGDEDSDIEALFPTQEKEHVIGVRLFVLLAAATVGAFVGLLDTSIISTVSVYFSFDDG